MPTAEVDFPERGPWSRQYFKVYGPFRKIPFKFVCLSQSMLKRCLHFDPIINRNVPCMGEEDCPYCTRHQFVRFKGFVAAVRCDTHEPCVAEITEHAAWELRGRKLNLNRMRGQIITLQRLSDDKNAKVGVRDVRPHREPKKLPKSWDVLHDLERLWGWMHDHEYELRIRAAAEKRFPDMVEDVPLAEDVA